MNLTFIDFEMLTENQMQFKGIDWEAQADRFDQAPNFEHEYIYWVENSAALVLATKYLQQQGYEFHRAPFMDNDGNIIKKKKDDDSTAQSNDSNSES